MEQGKSEIVIAKQQNKLTALTSINLPVSSKKYLELHYGCKKVKEYEQQDLKNLFKFMLALCKLVGVTEAPDNEIILLLIDHIQEHHSDFSKEEIQKAFSMATAGKLDFEFVHYNRLTPQLVSSVCNSYKRYRSKEVIAYENKLNAIADEERREREKPTPKQQLISRVTSCLENLEKYKEEIGKPVEKRVSVRDWGSMNYLFLEELGIINYTNDVKLEIKEEAKERLIEEKRKKFVPYGKKGIGKLIQEMNEGNPIQLISESRQVALDRYFDNVIEFELNLKSELEEKLTTHESELYKEVGTMLKNATNRKGD